jgi:hypothetical protein
MTAEHTYQSDEGGSAGSAEGSVQRRLDRLRTMKSHLGKNYQRLSATLMPTVQDPQTPQLTVDMAVYMESVQATLDGLLRLEENRAQGKPDPHLLAVQKATIEMVKRDMVQVSRTTVVVAAFGFAVVAVGNLAMFTMMALHIAIVTPDMEPPAPRNSSVESAADLRR